MGVTVNVVDLVTTTILVHWNTTIKFNVDPTIVDFCTTFFLLINRHADCSLLALVPVGVRSTATGFLLFILGYLITQDKRFYPRGFDPVVGLGGRLMLVIGLVVPTLKSLVVVAFGVAAPAIVKSLR